MSRLGLVTQTLLVAARPHAFTALVFGNFRFSSFFQGSHIEGDNRCRSNHLTSNSATPFLPGPASQLPKIGSQALFRSQGALMIQSFELERDMMNTELIA